MVVTLEDRSTLAESLPSGRDRLEGTTARVDDGLFSIGLAIPEIDGSETTFPREGDQLSHQVTTPFVHPAELQFSPERWHALDSGQNPRLPCFPVARIRRYWHPEGQIVEVWEPADEIQDISSLSGRGVEVKRAYGRNEVREVGVEVFEEAWGIEPEYAQFLDPVEALEMVVVWFEVRRGEVLVEVDEEVTGVWQ